MGNLCGGFFQPPPEPVKVLNEEIEIPEDAGPPPDVEGEIHVLLVGLDYSCDTQSWAGRPPQGPLDTKYAFEMMQELCQQAGVTSTKCLWNEECTREGVKDAIAEVAELCGPNDYFVFYYTGHGDQMPDEDGLEEDGMDECLCLVDENGNTDDAQMQLRHEVWMRDDEFVHTLFEHFHSKQTHMLFLNDCCHSGSLTDFETDKRWSEHAICAVSIAGCQDNETSAGTGKGGYFTRSLTMVLQDINNQNFQESGDEGEDYPTCAEVYNRVRDKYLTLKSFAHTQNITISYAGCDPATFPFPLKPKGYYVSPANSHYKGLQFD